MSEFEHPTSYTPGTPEEKVEWLRYARSVNASEDRTILAIRPKARTNPESLEFHRARSERWMLSAIVMSLLSEQGITLPEDSETTEGDSDNGVHQT